MLWSFLLNVPFTFGLLITYLFCIGDISDALSATTGYPFIYVFQNATGTDGAIALTSIIFVLLIMITISTMASTTQQAWAFARNGGFPFSQLLAHVHPKLHIPVNSIILTILYTVILSLINIGSTVAFNAFLSLGSCASVGTYLISITCVTYKRIRKQPLPAARWNLGKAGLPINIIAIGYAAWAFFWSFWPNEYQPTAVTFNWACALFVGAMAIATVYYWTYGRRTYEGPVAKVRW